MQRGIIGIRDILSARRTVSKNLLPTLLTRYEGLSRLVGADIYIKHENHLPAGSCKVRGTVNLVWELKQNGVDSLVSVYSGSFSLALVYAASQFDMDIRIIAPKKTSPYIIQKLKEFGARVSLSGESIRDTLRIAEQVEADSESYFVHPAEEKIVIAGVATLFVDILEALPSVDVVICPVVFGTTIAAATAVFRGMSLPTRVIGVQAELASSAHLAWSCNAIGTGSSGTRHTCFDLDEAFSLPLSIYGKQLADFVLLSDDKLDEGIALSAFHTQQLVDAVGGSPIMAAVSLSHKIKGKTVVLVMDYGGSPPIEVEPAFRLPSLLSGAPKKEVF